MSAAAARLRGRRNGSLRVVSRLLVLAHLTGCTAWKSVPDAMYRPAGDQTIGAVRILLADGTRHSLDGVVARTDSVIGFEPERRTRLAFAHEQVSRIEQRQFQLGRTVALVGSAVVLAFVVAAATAVSELGDLLEESASLAPSVP